MFLAAPRAARHRVTTPPHAAFAHGVAPVPGYCRRARSRATAPFGRGARASREVLPGFRPLQRSQPVASTLPNPGFPRPVRSVSRDSHPPDGFLHDQPCELVSSHWRSWGSTLQSSTSRGAVTPLGARCPPDVRDTDPPTAPRRAEAYAGLQARRTQSQQGTMEADAVRLQGVQLPSGVRSRRAAV